MSQDIKEIGENNSIHKDEESTSKIDITNINLSSSEVAEEIIWISKYSKLLSDDKAKESKYLLGCKKKKSKPLKSKKNAYPIKITYPENITRTGPWNLS